MGVGEGSGGGKGRGAGCGAGCDCSECCINCSRVTLIVFNSLFLVIGLGALGTGIWLVVDPNVIQILQLAGGIGQGTGIIRVLAYILLAVGGVLIIVGIFGLAGASRWNQCLLATYIALCVILLCAQIATFVMGFLSHRYIQNALRTEMVDFITTRYDDGDNLLSNGYRRMQANMKCCGVNNGSDWVTLNTAWYRINGTATGWSWPRTCCDLENQRDPNSPPRNELECRAGNPEFYNSRGCYNQLYYFLRAFSFAIGGAIVGLFVLQIIIISLAGVVHKAVKEAEYGMNGVKPMVV